MLEHAEKNMNKTLVDKPTTELHQKLQHDASKFISERLGKEHYSTRKELTDAGGKRLFQPSHALNAKKALDDLFEGVPAVPVSVNDVKKDD